MSDPAPPILDYRPRDEFDTGRFLARYFQVLACLSIAWMIAAPIFFNSLDLDVSPIFMFWAASALRRHSPTARKWVLGVTGLPLAVGTLLFLSVAFFGAKGISVAPGGPPINNPAVSPQKESRFRSADLPSMTRSSGRLAS